MNKPSRYHAKLDRTDKEIRVWLQIIADMVAASALKELAAKSEPPGLGVRPDQAGQRLNDWLRPMVVAAEKIGAEAARVALFGLGSGGIASTLVELAKSQQASRNRGKVRNPAGGSPTVWRADIGGFFRNSRFLKRLETLETGLEAEVIINKAISAGIIEERDESFFDRDGNQIAASKIALRSEISRIKTRVLAGRNQA